MNFARSKGLYALCLVFVLIAALMLGSCNGADSGTDDPTDEAPIVTTAPSVEESHTKVTDNETVPNDTKPQDTKPQDTTTEATKPEDTDPQDTTSEDTKPGVTECAHEWGEWTETVPATCDKKGTLSRSCAKCGETEESVSDEKGHTLTVIPAVEPTCTEPGAAEGKQCTVCGEKVEPPALIAPKGHTEVTDPAILPSCTENGYTEGKHCSVCNTVTLAQQTVDAMGHLYLAEFIWSEDLSSAYVSLNCARNSHHTVTLIDQVSVSQNVTEPTCTAEGRIEFTASVSYDGQTHTDIAVKTLEKKPHSFAGGVCSACGETIDSSDCDHSEYERKNLFPEGACIGWINVAQCTICGEILETYYMNMTCPVNISSAENIIDDNGDVIGKKISASCSVCGNEYYNEYKTEKTASCSEIYTEYLSIHRGGVLLTELDYSRYTEEHSYEESYTLLGESCEDGVVLTNTCSLCGVSNETTVYNHRPDYSMGATIVFPGPCSSSASGAPCMRCSEIVNIGRDTLYLGCEFDEENILVESITDADGNEIGQKITKTCKNCLTKIVSVLEYTEKDGCAYYVNEIFEAYTAGGELILTYEDSFYDDRHQWQISYEPKGDDCSEDGVTVTEYCTVCEKKTEYVRYSHQTEEYVILRFSDICQSYANVDKCSICGKINYVNDFQIGCAMDESQGIVETIYDDRGNAIGEKTTLTCSVCGLVVTYADWTEDVSICVKYEHYSAAVYRGEECLFTYEDYDARENHNVTLNYSLIGEDCSDGVYITENCTICGNVDDYTVYGHDYAEHVTITLSSACGTYAEVEQCVRCNFIDYMYDFGMKCAINEELATVEVIYDDLGNAIGQKTACTCSSCGLVFVISEWKETLDVCKYYDLKKIEVYSGEELIFHFTESDYNSTHDWQYEEILLGDSCEDGVEIREYCSICGDSWSDIEFYHEDTIYDNFSLEEFTSCGGYFEGSRCTRCDEVVYLYGISFECNFDYDNRSYETIFNESGWPVGYKTVVKCLTCGIEYAYTETTEDINSCECDYYELHEIYVNGECVLRGEDSHRATSHDYEYSFELLGQSCTDGVKITARCEDCGDTYVEEDNEHSLYMMESIDLTEKNVCGGYCDLYECVCGERKYLSVYFPCYDSITDEIVSIDGIDHYVTKYSCSVCGFHAVMDDYYETVDCRNYHYTVWNVGVGETQIISDHIAYDLWYDHEYEASFNVNGDSCDDGYTVIYKCIYCDDSYTEENDSHRQYITKHINFSDHGGCGGYFKTSSCACGLNNSRYWYMECNYTYNSYATEIDGVEHFIETYSCDTCGILITLDSYSATVGCAHYTYAVLNIQIGDAPIVTDHTEIGVWYEHIYEDISYELYGQSCEDGCKVTYKCIYCDESYGDEYSWHCRYTDVYIDLYEKNTCGGSLEREVCLCGEEVSMYMYSYCYDYEITEETKVIDGVEHKITSYKCRSCSLEQIIDEYEERSGCAIRNCRVYSFILGDEVLVSDWMKFNEYYEHTYSYSYQMYGESCTDGFLEIKTCTGCGISEQKEIYYHRKNSTVYDVTQYGACYGNVTATGCLCADLPEMISAATCAYYVGAECVEIDGVSHDISTYYCSTCGLTVYYDSYSQLVGCQANNYCEVRAVIGGVELEFGCYIRSYYELHDHSILEFDLKGDSCEDGYTVYMTCTRCGDVYSRYDDSHRYRYQKEIVEFTESESCGGGYISTAVCACGAYSDVNRYLNDCIYDYSSEDVTVDGIMYRYENYTCRTCGISVTLENHIAFDGCYRNKYKNISAKTSEREVALDTVSDIESELHEYNYSFDMRGQTCDDGYTVTRVCAFCQRSESFNAYGHNIYSKEIWLERYGACNGCISVNICPCGDEAGIAIDSYCTIRTSEETKYWRGVAYYITKYECADCGLSLTEVIYGRKDGCKVRVHKDVYIRIGDKEWVESVEEFRGEVRHEFEYTTELIGETCEKGGTITSTCKHCGYSETTEIQGNHYSGIITEISLNEYDICGATLRLEICPCGESFYGDVSMQCDYDRTYEDYTVDGINYRMTTRTCNTCGLVLSDITYTKFTGCIEYRYHVYKAKIGDTELEFGPYRELEGKYHINYETPRLEMYGTSCEDGILVTYICKVCGDETSYEEWYHNTGWRGEYVNFADIGGCGGYVAIGQCLCGEYGGATYEVKCRVYEFDRTYYNGDYGHIGQRDTYHCSQCGLDFVYDKNDYVGNCKYYEVYSATVKIGDTEIKLGPSYNFNKEEHEWVYTFDLFGETCQDGYTVTVTCENCDYFAQHDDASDHWMYWVDYTRLTACCEGIGGLNIDRCACGKYIEHSFGRMACEIDYEYLHEKVGDIDHHIEKAVCKVCGSCEERDEEYLGDTLIAVSYSIYAGNELIYTYRLKY